MIKASIVGGSGYAGGELLRLIINHPKAKIHQVTSKRFVGMPVTLNHPNLRSKTNLIYSRLEDLEKCDVLFVGLPNGKSMSLMNKLSKLAPKVIDLGADFRLREREVFESWYKVKHENVNLLKDFVYGLPELSREKIKKASLVACGGCEATAVILALYPLAKEKLLDKNLVIADVKIGSSAAGNKAKSSSHHPERQGVLRSYKPTHHRHQAEILQETGVTAEISATAVNLVRGILATIHVQLKKGVDEKQVWGAYRKIYQDEPFIRLVKQKQGLYRYPEPKLLWGTNYCDIGFEKSPDSNRLVVLSAIDNLVKGTAGNAVACMNLMTGLEETLGLEFSGLHPV